MSQENPLQDKYRERQMDTGCENISKITRKVMVWRLLDSSRIPKGEYTGLTPLMVELIHIMLFRDWECGYKNTSNRAVIVGSINAWIYKIFDQSHLIPSPILYRIFLDIDPFYFGNEEVARIILRWRDRQIRKDKEQHEFNQTKFCY